MMILNFGCKVTNNFRNMQEKVKISDEKVTFYADTFRNVV